MLGLVLLAATAAAQPQAPPRGPVVRNATATVRIVAGATIKLAEIPAEAIVREVEDRSSDGTVRPSRLIEFP